MLALPVYFIRKKLTGSKTTLLEDLWAWVIRTPQRQPPNPITEELDKVQSGIETVYLFLLYGAIALVTGFIIYFFRTLPRDSNRDFLWFYFGVGYLVFMLFAAGQVFAIKSGRRRAKRANRRAAPQAPWSSGAGLGSGAPAHEFSFQLGSAPAGGSGLEVRMGFSAPPVEEKLDNASLAKAESCLVMGESLETACLLIDPRFAGWSKPMQGAYKQYLRQALEEGRSHRAESAWPGSPPQSSSGTSKPAAAFTIFGLNAAQLAVAVMTFVAALAAFLSIMILHNGG